MLVGGLVGAPSDSRVTLGKGPRWGGHLCGKTRRSEVSYQAVGRMGSKERGGGGNQVAGTPAGSNEIGEGRVKTVVEQTVISTYLLT